METISILDIVQAYVLTGFVLAWQCVRMGGKLDRVPLDTVLWPVSLLYRGASVTLKAWGK